MKFIAHITIASTFILFSVLNLLAADAENSKNAGHYAFSYFTGNGEDGLHLALSRDGLTWEAVNEGKSLLAPEVGKTTRLMRDPSICQGPDGTFHMVWTVAWDGRSIGYASSKDLVTWSPQKPIPVMEHEPTCRNCWAPELFYDDATRQFYIIWSSTIPGRFSTDGTSEDKYDHRMYVTTTADFEKFAPTKLYFDPGHNVIDGFLAKKDDVYYLFYKDETLKPEPKKTILLATGPSAAGPFTVQDTISPQNWVEGPTALWVDDACLVYFDCYASKSFGVIRSRDFKTWENLSDKLKLPRGIRHGTTFPIPAEVYDNLCK